MIYEHIIVGSGAGGSVAFSHLARDHRTLLLEEGAETADSLAGLKVSKVNELAYRNSGIRPALGFPTLAIGEGMAIGGSTEVNGGLFWRTPAFVLQEWEKKGLAWAKDGKLIPIFEDLEKRLNVQLERDLIGFDADSDKLDLGARRLGWLSVRVPRLTTNCSRANFCPSGCPSGAKQTASRTFLKDGIASGGVILSGVKVYRIVRKRDFVEVHGMTKKGKERFKTRKLILSAGAIETPKLLIKSRMLSPKKVRISFHANAKVFAEFGEEVNSTRGTIFTRQIQEFLEEGILIMGANVRPEYFAMASAHLSDEVYEKLRTNFSRVGIYTTQSRVLGSIRFSRLFFGKYFLRVKWGKHDKDLIFSSLNHASEALFAAGAQAVYLPFKGEGKFTSQVSVEEFLDSATFRDLQISTVHLMSSLPLNAVQRNSIDQYGRLRKDPRVQILDASILPSSIVESPQGTIMALSEYILRETA